MMLRTILATMTVFFVAGCVTGGSVEAYCDGSAVAIREHAAALAEDGGPKSIRTGTLVIRQRDAACGE